MSININKFNNFADYTTGNKPVGECCVSQIGNDTIYDGVNVVLKKEQLGNDDVCLVAKDSINGDIVYIPVATYNSATFDSDRYALKDYIRFGQSLGRQILIHKEEGLNTIWVTWNRYQIVPDLTANGGFTATITINGTAKANTVSWNAGDTLASVIDQWTEIVATYLPKPVAGTLYSDGTTPCINVTTGGYTNSTLTLSNATGATLYDLSEVCAINGVLQTASHRTWQAQSVAAMFPSLGFNAATTTCYSNAGYNKQYRCIVNKEKGLSYWRTSGNAAYKTEAGIEIMKEAAFDACNGSGVAEQQALYDKYDGSYEAYIEGQMVSLNDSHKTSVEYLSYDNGNEQTQLIAGIETIDFDGQEIPAYPAAANAASKNDSDFGISYLPSCHDIALFMNDSRFSLINRGFTILGGATKLQLDRYYWAVAEYSASSAWVYYGTNGTLNNYNKYNFNRVRFLASV